jgi:hypothetical protein
MDTLQTRLLDLATRIRSMPVPTQDRVWEKFRHEKALLSDLVRHDYDLIAPACELRDEVQTITVDGWDEATATTVRRAGDNIERSIRARAEFLRIPG